MSIKQNEILRIHGTDHTKMTVELLEAAGLFDEIKNAVKGSSDPLIGIKPNLVSPTPAMFGATTHPEVIEGIILYLHDHGLKNLIICEGSWVGDKTADAFRYCGYDDLAEKYGVRLFDTKKDLSFQSSAGRGEIKLNICSIVSDIDFLINVPVLKGHCQTKVTCALKNMKGLIPDNEKRRFHSLGLHMPIAQLGACIRQDFIVTDHICGDPDFEDGGNPLIRNYILASKDPVLTDAYAAKVLGYRPDEIRYITLAEQIGVGKTDLSELILSDINRKAASSESKTNCLKKGQAGSESKDAEPHFLNDCDAESAVLLTHKALMLNYATNEINSCSSCYSALTSALSRLHDEGVLRHLTDDLEYRFCIGQGYKGAFEPDRNCIGIGNCTSLFTKNIPGCPPSEDDIYKHLSELK